MFCDPLGVERASNELIHIKCDLTTSKHSNAFKTILKWLHLSEQAL